MGYNCAKKKMKKIFLLLVALIGISYVANAQSCKISGTNDGSTILCTDQHLDGNKVVVNLSNDSENTCANVTVTVEVTYENNSTKTFQGRGKSCPNAEAAINVYIETVNNGKNWKKYEVTGVSGNKCN